MRHFSFYSTRILMFLFLLLALTSSSAHSQSRYDLVLDQLKTEKSKVSGTKDAGELLTRYLTDSIFPHWYGLPWDFNGHTNRPDTGEIACGYFVSTTLKHAGFNLNRYKLAQQTSMTGTRSLDPDGIDILRGKTVEELVEFFKEKSSGLWTVGLSYHVGFLEWTGKELYFIHSTYLSPGAVVREKALESEALEMSTIYCLGDITHNDWLMRQWLSGGNIPIRK